MPKFVGKMSSEPQIVHRGNQHALREVAARAEEDDVARIGDPVGIESLHAAGSARLPSEPARVSTLTATR